MLSDKKEKNTLGYRNWQHKKEYSSEFAFIAKSVVVRDFYFVLIRKNKTERNSSFQTSLAALPQDGAKQFFFLFYFIPEKIVII